MRSVDAAALEPGTVAWTKTGRRVEIDSTTTRRGYVGIRYYHEEIGAWVHADVPPDYQLTLRDPEKDAAVDAEILILRSALERIAVAVSAGHTRCPFCSCGLDEALIRSMRARIDGLEKGKEDAQ